MKYIQGNLCFLLDEVNRKKLFLIFTMMTFGAFLELLGISMVAPMVATILNYDSISTNSLISGICSIMHIASKKGFILCCIFSLLAVFILKNLYLVFMHIVQNKFVYENRFCMQKRILHAILKKPYTYFLYAKSGDTLRLIENDVQKSYDILMNYLTVISESIVSIILIIFLFMMDPLMTIVVIGILMMLVVLIKKLISPILKKEGEIFRKSWQESYKWILQTIQGIKEIKVANQESFFEYQFNQAGETKVTAEKRYRIFGSLPRIIIEMGCICSVLIAMAVMVIFDKDLSKMIVTLSTFAMAAIKLIPAANKIITIAGNISFHGPSIDRLKEVLEDKEFEEQGLSCNNMPITLNRNIRFEHVSYRYMNSSESILENADMMIPVGHTVGIVGPSGIGKTTTVDILLGLLRPQNGNVLADGTDIFLNYESWLSQVGYIPQSIFMLDGSIRENVVFGATSINDDKVWESLEYAKLADFVRNQPEGLDTLIGERGIRISGGQRQRIGIARALYADPQLLVFDEATSSLDTKTEKEIMESIDSLHGKKTIVIISHRNSTIENCDIVYEVTNRRIKLKENNTDTACI